MKISKLFHWLYAMIMFLPVFFWIPTAFYYGFNEHAANPSTTDVQINYKYQSNVIETSDDFVEDNIYSLNINSNSFNDTDSYFNCYCRIISGSLTFSNLDHKDDSFDHFTLTNNTEYYINFQTGNWVITFDYGEEYISFWFTNLSSTDLVIQFISFDEIYLEGSDTLNDFFSYTDYNEIESVNVVETGGISNAMNKSWQDVWTLPMFSWTHDTFFSAPFNYIASLFGIQAGNTLSYCLSYWFSISIIWLVFDLMIYVPLLVHRWLDKAAIE